MDYDKKIYSLLGLAQKAGQIKSGEFMTEQSIKDRTAKLVIVASDASDNTKKHFTDMCVYRKIPIYVWGIKDDLGHATGKEFRASLAVTQEGFAKSIKEKMETVVTETRDDKQEDDN